MAGASFEPARVLLHAGYSRRPVSHRLWRRVIAKAGVRYRSPEQFRHTFASTMLSRNAPLLYVQKQGGWKSTTVMLSVYARWLPGPDAAHPVAPSAHLEAARATAEMAVN